MSDLVQTEQRETMNSAEVAEFLSLDIESILRLVKDGRLPAYRIEGTRKWVFYRKEIKDCLVRQKVTVTD